MVVVNLYFRILYFQLHVECIIIYHDNIQLGTFPKDR